MSQNRGPLISISSRNIRIQNITVRSVVFDCLLLPPCGIKPTCIWMAYKQGTQFGFRAGG